MHAYIDLNRYNVPQDAERRHRALDKGECRATERHELGDVEFPNGTVPHGQRPVGYSRWDRDRTN